MCEPQVTLINKLIKLNRLVVKELRVWIYSLHMNTTGSLPRSHVAVMAETKRKDPPTSFEGVLGVGSVPTLPVTWLFNYFLDLVR